MKIFDLRSFAIARPAPGLPGAGLRILSGPHMACSISPVGSGRLGSFSEAGALVKIHSQGERKDLSVNPIIDLEFGGAQSLVNIDDCVGSGSCDIREIKPPDFIA